MHFQLIYKFTPGLDYTTHTPKTQKISRIFYAVIKDKAERDENVLCIIITVVHFLFTFPFSFVEKREAINLLPSPPYCVLPLSLSFKKKSKVGNDTILLGGM